MSENTRAAAAGTAETFDGKPEMFPDTTSARWIWYDTMMPLVTWGMSHVTTTSRGAGDVRFGAARSSGAGGMRTTIWSEITHDP